MKKSLRAIKPDWAVWPQIKIYLCLCLLFLLLITPRQVVPQPGLSSAAPKNIETLEPGPKISEKSADLSLKVGKSDNTNQSLENIFPANPASKSPLQKQQINVQILKGEVSPA